MLEQLGSSLLVSTYQTGKLICARHDRGMVNTHFRDFQRPMGLAVAPGRIAIGTRAEVLDYRNVPAVAPKVEPRGRHDACFVPRNKHFTGDIRIHEIAFAQGELWIVATNFSCLATLDAEHSFVPRWTPPFITELGPEDRCHLNGLCVIDDQVRYVTALGETNEPGGWRESKADGGILIDVDLGRDRARAVSRCPTRRAGTTAGCGCSSPARARSRSPTSTRARSRRSPSCPASPAACCSRAASPSSGSRRCARRRPSAGLPLMERLDERLCGVWVVDPESGKIARLPALRGAGAGGLRRRPAAPGCATPRSPRRAATRPASPSFCPDAPA